MADEAAGRAGREASQQADRETSQQAARETSEQAAREAGQQAGREANQQAGGSAHSALCLRLMQLFPRVSRGMRRWQDRAAPAGPAPLGPRHVAALEQLRGGPIIVGELASRLGLTMPTVSGVLADLDRAGFVERHPDPADRRRTIVQIAEGRKELVSEWLDGAAGPLARVLDRLSPGEQQAFLKAMDLLETELRNAPNP